MFYVHQICITCDKLAELKLHVLRKQSFVQCYEPTKKSFNDRACFFQKFLKPTCSSFATQSCTSSQSSTVEAWNTFKIFSPIVKQLDLACSFNILSTYLEQSRKTFSHGRENNVNESIAMHISNTSLTALSIWTRY